MAAASGLELIPPEQRDVLRASTFGVGQLIRSALDRGAEEILIGIGGSATNDGGAGMLTALGASFVDADGQPARTRRRRTASVSTASTCPAWTRGCATPAFTWPPTSPRRFWDPQVRPPCSGLKRAPHAADVQTLESALTRLATVTSATLGKANPQRPGAGAAGGVGFALVEFLGAESKPGVDEVAETVGLERALRGADWVFTGEGSVDAQTVMGKTPFGVAQAATRAGTRVVIFAGRVAPDASVLLEHGVDRLVAITAEGTPIEQALREGAESLTRATADVCREITGS